MERMPLNVDILLEKESSTSDIQLAMQAAFGLEYPQVVVTDDYFRSINDLVKVVCYVNQIQGEFSLLLSVFIKDKKLNSDLFAGVKIISAFLKSKCVIPQFGMDPYKFWQINPDGDIIEIFFDESQLENGRYFVVKT